MAHKKSYFADRKTELICHILRCAPEEVERTFCTQSIDRTQVAEKFVSYAVGVAFGRWTADQVDRSALDHFVRDPFDKLPSLPPAACGERKEKAILASDQGNSLAVVGSVQNALEQLWPGVPGRIEGEIAEALGCYLTRYFERDFFSAHISQYSKSRRIAPIYWPLSTTSGSYTLWLYYPSLTSQTLYTAVNVFIEGPNGKLQQVGRELRGLRDKGSARSRDDEKAFEALQALELELIELRDTLLEIAPTYRPNHDDGVQITAAPLWPLFRHRPWQKVLKETWAKLEKGDYDWAHLAMAYWPERVREKCRTDKSLAIAHDLEQLYVEPERKAKKPRGRKGKGVDA